MPIAQATGLCTHAIAQSTIHKPSIAPDGHIPVNHVPVSRITVEQHDPQLDQEGLQKVASIFQDQFTPLVALESLDPKPWSGHPRHQCESLLCDITGIAHLFGGEAGLLHAIDRKLASINLAARTAIADHIGTAWAVAHAMTPSALDQSSKEISRSDLPPRSFIIPTGLSAAAVEYLDVTCLRIEQATVDTLARLGIQTVGQLTRLPRSGLASRLGRPLIKRMEQSLGESDEPISVCHLPEDHCESLSLEYATTDQAILIDRIARLIRRIRAGMVTHQLGALRMVCHLDLSAHPPLHLEIGLFAPTIDVDHLSELFAGRIESIRLASEVTRITVAVTLTGPLRSRQISLLDDSSSYDSGASGSMGGSSISRLVDSLSGRLGRDRVVGVGLSKDPLPENAFHTTQLAGNLAVVKRKRFSRQRKTKTNQPTSLWNPAASDHLFRSPSSSDAFRRPLTLLSSPAPLLVSFSGGSFCQSVSITQVPARIRASGLVFQVVRYRGPERIETGWWDGPSIRRDYYRVETDRQQWLWIYRDLKPITGSDHSDDPPRFHWFMHGRFA